MVHGGPITPAMAAHRIWTGRHAFVSFARPEQLPLAAEVLRDVRHHLFAPFEAPTTAAELYLSSLAGGLKGVKADPLGYVSLRRLKPTG